MIANYIRVSTAEQMKEGYSIGEQQERLRAYCFAMGWKDIKVYIDGGYSGGNMNRPALQDLIKDVKAGKISRVVVFKLDRLSRSQKDTLELIEDVFTANDVDFVSMSENFQTSTPFGRASIGILAVFAQLEREQIKERVTIGREARAKEGKWHGGNSTPVGYDYVNGGLVVNDFEAMQIRDIYKLYLSGKTYTEIANELNDKGLTHKHGRWLPQRVRRVLTNPVYIGVVTFGGQTSTGIHEAIIDRKTFERVAAIIKKPTGKPYKRRPISEAYLLGKLYCEKCGARYTHIRLTSGHKPDGKKLSYYCCSNRLHKNVVRCDNKNHRCDSFDEVVLDELRGLRFADVLKYRKQTEPDNVAVIESKLDKINKQRSRLFDLFSVGSFDVDELSAKIAELDAAKRTLEEQISESRQRPVKDIKAIISNVGDIIDNGTPEQIRLLIDSLITRIDINGEDITIYWNFD